MTWGSAATIYALFWALSAFLVLPFVIRPADAPGTAPPVPGQAAGAPAEFRAGRWVVRTTILAAVLSALFIANYRYGWITLQTFDWWD